ncbi:MAG TPA: PAS domain S-box protein [Candidatus Thermoplasmatota archaeon]|nr:PAS domain S-box protein [Candidatus Thermoplasmatota archaeon]
MEKYRLLFDNASDLIAVVDTKGNFLELNKKFEEESMYPREEMIGKNVFTSGIVSKKSSTKISSIFSKAVNGEPAPIIEVEGVTKHGDIVPYELRIVPLIKNNKVVAVQGILRNLTERKEAEKQVRDRDERFHLAITHSNMIYAHCDTSLRYTWIYNPHPDFDSQDVIGKRDVELADNTGTRQLMQLKQQVIETGNPVRKDISFPTSEGIQTYDIIAEPLMNDSGSIYGVATCSLDITQRKQAEKERNHHIKELNMITDLVVNASRIQNVDELCHYLGESIQSLNKNSYVTISLYDPKVDGIHLHSLCGFESVANKLSALLNNDPTQVVVKPDNIPEDSPLYRSGQLNRVHGGLYDIMANALPKETCDAIEKKLGIEAVYRVGLSLDEKPFGSISILLKDSESIQFKSVIETVANYFSVIVHQKQTDLKVRESREQFQNLFDSLQDGVFVHSLLPNGQPSCFEQTNKAASTMLGYSSDEFKQMTPWDLDDPERCKEYIPIALQQLQEKGNVVFEAIQVTKNGRKIPVEVNANVVEYKGKKRIISVTRDITEKKKSQKALIFQNALMKTQLEVSPDGILVVDENDKIISFNQHFADIWGIPDSIMSLQSGEKALEYVLPKLTNPDEFANRVHDLYKNKQEKSYEEIALTDGKILERYSSPMFGSNDEYYGRIWYYRDITERKRAEEEALNQKKYLETILQTTADGFWIVGKNKKITQVNDAYCRMSGYSKEEIQQRTINDIDVKEESDEIESRIRRIIQNGSEMFESKHRRKDGSVFDVEISTTFLNIYGGQFICFCRDITERKRAEENLKQMHLEVQGLNESLEKKVVQRTERIKQLLEQKDEFINQLGHDLKNPLGPFMHLLPILKNHVINEKDKEMVEVLMRNTNYMRNLVKKTIDLAQLNSSKTTFTFEDVSLGNLVNEVVSVNSSLFENHEVIVENNVSSDLLVHVDSFHIQEVFTNLFNNAVKYSKDERWIGIDAVEQDDCVLVTVRDKGIGITKDQIGRLFDEYYKADSSRHDFESNGLGLPICKRIVEKHGGRIWAESEGLGKGSTFYFTLPDREQILKFNLKKKD